MIIECTRCYTLDLINEIQDLLYQYESEKITHSTFINTLQTIANHELEVFDKIKIKKY